MVYLVCDAFIYKSYFFLFFSEVIYVVWAHDWAGIDVVRVALIVLRLQSYSAMIV